MLEFEGVGIPEEHLIVVGELWVTEKACFFSVLCPYPVKGVGQGGCLEGDDVVLVHVVRFEDRCRFRECRCFNIEFDGDSGGERVCVVDEGLTGVDRCLEIRWVVAGIEVVVGEYGY